MFKDWGKGRFLIGENVRIALGSKFYINRVCEIGSNTYINPNALILVNEGLKIGSNCALSWNLQIIDDDLHEIIKDDLVCSSKKVLK